jgi:PII-like signaling protein
VREKDRVHGKPAFEWLLDTGRALGLPGGSAFRAVAGFGRHRRLHEDRFFELAGDMAIQVEFVLSREEADRLLAEAGAAGAVFAFMETACRHGTTGGQA